MKESTVIDFVKLHFSDHRKKLIPLIHAFEQNNSVLKEIYTSIKNEIKRPVSGQPGIGNIATERLKDGEWENGFGDVADIYTILLNPEIEEVEDWDFEEKIKKDQEIHICRLWINWFLPVYYIETNYEKGINNGTLTQIGPLKKISDFESDIIQKITEIMTRFNYHTFPLSFFQQKTKGTETDISEEADGATIFECLFSDLVRSWNQHERQPGDGLKDPYDDKLTIRIRDILDDNFELTERARTLYYDFFGYVTIITDKNQNVKEVICRGFIDGIAGNEKTIKIGR